MVNDGINDQVTGYLHPLYAASLAEFGNPRELPACGGWILERSIPGATHRDAMGCYPLFFCRDWNRLPIDLAQLEDQLISLAFVTDPFCNFQVEDLKQNFDICFHFKEHYIRDLSRPIETIISKGHRRNALQALQKVVVEPCLDPSAYVDEWTNLYDSLVVRHSIQGIRKFSRVAFEKQMHVPGTVYFRVLYNGRPIGGDIYYLQNDVAYAHLVAFTDVGYSLDASYAVKWSAIEYFTGKASWIDLGGGAGLTPARNDGAIAFKRGWATETRPVYFCGRILEREAYAKLANAAAMPNSAYFPIYRAGEFR
jgi:hypothetical protein